MWYFAYTYIYTHIYYIYDIYMSYILYRDKDR